ncbi:hypothetical protein N9383_04510 [Granulosicoccus sp.]|nr:hypothetical protein [Granulosicoccus sp.]
MLECFVSRRDTSFDEVSEVTAEELRSSSNRVQVDASMLPLSYSVEGDGSVTVVIVNNHSEPLDVFSVDVLAIDDQGNAFAHDVDLPLTVVAPGEELEVRDIFRRFTGSASTIRAIIDFELP